ncbi:hypothetical protein ABMA28_007023 [Loxostege sticticalis]|uniref:Retrotransposon gag domain-containing protein n=1 Tax=Loxostege sticticalis TaxID=481309 RepID=A0ABD0TPN3_LOXSC
MSSDGENGTPPGTPPRRSRHKKRTSQRRTSSSSESDDQIVTRKARKTSSRLTAKDVLNLLISWKGETSKPSVLSNSSMNNVVPEFNPSNRAQNIHCWLRKVNECAIIYGWDEKQVIHFSLQRLVGLAKRWFEALPTVVYTWDEWQTKLRKAFPSEENYGRLLEEMLCRTSRSDESIREYFYDKLNLLSRCEISGKKAADCIVYGIHDKSIRNSAQSINYSEPEDLLTFLCSQKPQSDLVRVRERTDKRENSVNKDNVSSTFMKCYNCNVKGHPFYKCNQPLLKCKICNRIGHDNDKCRLEPLKVY